MSLSTLLLGSKASIDTELDGLFKVSPKAPVPILIPGSSKATVHRKRKPETASHYLNHYPNKRTKADVEKQSFKQPKAKTADQVSLKSDKKAGLEEVQTRTGKKRKEKQAKHAVEELDSEDDSDLEKAYLNENAAPQAERNEDEGEEEGEATEGDSDMQDPDALLHESLKKDIKKRARSTKKYAPVDETPVLRDHRTIFIGNLPLEVASKKPLKKQLQRHILSFAPSAKIESVRFRSIPFQAPTAKLPTSDDEGDNVKSKLKATKEPRAHEKDRASVWRSKLDEQDDEKVKADEKSYLNPAQKKKIAFINQEFHSTADAVNAYVVFAHAPNTDGRPSNLPPPPPTMDPYEAAVLIAAQADGTLFLERMLRVDLVGKNKSSKPSRTVDGDIYSVLDADPRLSVFVGNLEFESKEEDLRVFFEGAMSAERGPPLTSREDHGDDSTKKPLTWVTRVRIVRDKDTQLGKGFAYVQFSDRQCVDEILAMEEDRLKFAKRKLRVQRCKTLPGSKHVGSTNTQSTKQTKPARTHVVVPKGDPALGEKLAGLPKEERKKLKSTDADRVARRLAKKKARMAMPPGAGKGTPAKKDRKRVRS